MKKFMSVNEWLSTSPDEVELNKVLSLINRGMSHQTRKLIYEKEQYLRKLNGIVRDYEKLEMKGPKEIIDNIKKVKGEIEVLKKDLPVFPKRATRVRREKVEKES